MMDNLSNGEKVNLVFEMARLKKFKKNALIIFGGVLLLSNAITCSVANKNTGKFKAESENLTKKLESCEKSNLNLVKLLPDGNHPTPD